MSDVSIDEPLECYECEQPIAPGQRAIMWADWPFDEFCIKCGADVTVTDFAHYWQTANDLSDDVDPPFEVTVKVVQIPPGEDDGEFQERWYEVNDHVPLRYLSEAVGLNEPVVLVVFQTYSTGPRPPHAAFWSG